MNLCPLLPSIYRMCTMFLPELMSFVAAILFAVHPIHTEAVREIFCSAREANNIRWWWLSVCLIPLYLYFANPPVPWIHPNTVPIEVLVAKQLH